MSKASQGNDKVIADFFKKSLLVIFILSALATTVYYFINRSKPPVMVEESNFQAPAQLKKIVDPPQTVFVEQSQQRGIDFIHENGATGERMLPETMGSGVAFIDFDNDGDQDIIFANGNYWSWDEKIVPAPTQKIYANDGQGYFTDVTEQMGLDDQFYGTGLAIGDVNNDGFDDVFFAAVGTNRLYINQQGKKFIKSDVQLDCTENGWSSSSGFFDYDNDGDLDLMVLNYVQWSKSLDLAANYKIDGIGRAYGPPGNFPGTHNCLFENEWHTANNKFSNVTESAGMVIASTATNDLEGKSLALAFSDINRDGWEDVIVANDTTRNFVFINQKDKTFKEQGAEIGLAYNAAGKATGAMGVDVTHYKNDQDMAVTIGNFANEMTSFYVNRASMGFFTDESVITGVGPKSRLALSFGLFFFDYDLDGRQDFFQTNGHVENDINKVQSAQHYAQKSQLFWNCGNDCERTYVSIATDTDLTNFDMVGRAAAYADIDNDGDSDVVITQVGRKAQLFINQTATANWIGVRLRMKDNSSVFGANITVETDKKSQFFNYSPTKSYLAQVQSGQIIGLGNDKLVRIVIDYKGKQQVIKQYDINQWNTISLE